MMAGLYDDFADFGSTNIGMDPEEVLSLEQARQAQVKAALIDNASIQTIRTLERNMSALYTTARLEVKRKDEEILRLRKLLERERRSLQCIQGALESYLSALQQRSQAVLDAGQAAASQSIALRTALESFKSLAEAPFSATGWAAPSSTALTGSAASSRPPSAPGRGHPYEGSSHPGGRDRSRSRERGGAGGGDRASSGYGYRGQDGGRGGTHAGGGRGGYGYQQDSRHHFHLSTTQSSGHLYGGQRQGQGGHGYGSNYR